MAQEVAFYWTMQSAERVRECVGYLERVKATETEACLGVGGIGPCVAEVTIVVIWERTRPSVGAQARSAKMKVTHRYPLENFEAWRGSAVVDVTE